MLPKNGGMPVDSPVPGVIPVRIPRLVGNGSTTGTDPDPDPTSAGAFAALARDRETRRDRARRKAHRSRLYVYAIVAVALVAFLVALASSDTGHVKVSWVFGSSHVSLEWLVLFAAILGWLLGIVATAAFRWRTRAPRSRSARRS